MPLGPWKPTTTIAMVFRPSLSRFEGLEMPRSDGTSSSFKKSYLRMLIDMGVAGGGGYECGVAKAREGWGGGGEKRLAAPPLGYRVRGGGGGGGGGSGGGGGGL